MRVVVFAELRSHASKLSTIKPCAKFVCCFNAKESFNPFSPEEIVDKLGVSPQNFIEFLATARNEGDADVLERGGLSLDGILDLRIRQRSLNR
jgi:hypothetical protein